MTSWSDQDRADIRETLDHLQEASRLLRSFMARHPHEETMPVITAMNLADREMEVASHYLEVTE